MREGETRFSGNFDGSKEGRVRAEIGKHRLALLVVIAEDRIRNVLSGEISRLIHEDDSQEIRRFLDWQGAQQQLIDQPKNRGVGSDAQGEGEHGHGSEAGAFAQLSRAVAKVLPERFQHRQAALIAVSLLRGLDSSQFDHGLAARLLGCHAQAEIVLDVHLKMAFDLLIEFPVLSLRLKQAAEPHHPSAQFSHGTSWLVISGQAHGQTIERRTSNIERPMRHAQGLERLAFGCWALNVRC